MVKFGKNKLKALNKLAKKQKVATGQVTNKILKKKQNADKKVTFQKEVLAQIDVANNPLVQNVSKMDLRSVLNESAKKTPKKPKSEQAQVQKPKPVKKQKQRQKTQIQDTKLLLTLMKKK